MSQLPHDFSYHGFLTPHNFPRLFNVWRLFAAGGTGVLRQGDYTYSDVDNCLAPGGMEIHITNERTGTLLAKVIDGQLYQRLP